MVKRGRFVAVGLLAPVLLLGCAFLQKNPYPPRPLSSDQKAEFDAVQDEELKRDLFALSERVNPDAPIIKHCLLRYQEALTARDVKRANKRYRECASGCELPETRGFEDYAEKYRRLCAEKHESSVADATLLEVGVAVRDFCVADSPLGMAETMRLAAHKLNNAEKDLGKGNAKLQKLSDEYDACYDRNRPHLERVAVFAKRPDVVNVGINIERLEESLRGFVPHHGEEFKELELLKEQLEAQKGIMRQLEDEAKLWDRIEGLSTPGESSASRTSEPDQVTPPESPPPATSAASAPAAPPNTAPAPSPAAPPAPQQASQKSDRAPDRAPVDAPAQSSGMLGLSFMLYGSFSAFMMNTTNHVVDIQGDPANPSCLTTLSACYLEYGLPGWSLGAGAALRYDLSWLLSWPESYVRVDGEYQRGKGTGTALTTIPIALSFEKGFTLGKAFGLYVGLGGGVTLASLDVPAPDLEESATGVPLPPRVGGRGVLATTTTADQTLTALQIGGTGLLGFEWLMHAHFALRLESVVRIHFGAASYEVDAPQGVAWGFDTRDDSMSSVAGRLGAVAFF